MYEVYVMIVLPFDVSIINFILASAVVWKIDHVKLVPQTYSSNFEHCVLKCCVGSVAYLLNADNLDSVLSSLFAG